MTQPKTLVEQLDAAQTGTELGAALLAFFEAVERERDDE